MNGQSRAEKPGRQRQELRRKEQRPPGRQVELVVVTRLLDLNVGNRAVLLNRELDDVAALNRRVLPMLANPGHHQLEVIGAAKRHVECDAARAAGGQSSPESLDARLRLRSARLAMRPGDG